jgi:hypothetical protein
MSYHSLLSFPSGFVSLRRPHYCVKHAKFGGFPGISKVAILEPLEAFVPLVHRHTFLPLEI